MKISFISLGCPKNTVNSEQMLYLVQQAGHEVVPAPEMADAVVINTCAFIESATQEAINTIIEIGFSYRRPHSAHRSVTIPDQ